MPNAPLYIALDLGSNSMAACYDDMQQPGLQMIGLQEFHHMIAGEPAGSSSPLLPTQISLKEPPHYKTPVLPDDHAGITFVDKNGMFDEDEEKKSVFRFFHKKLDPRKLMPNPKLIFQSGCDKAVPRVVLEVGKPETVQYSPASLLCHLTTQVLKNLVLHSSVLRQRYSNRTITLALTVPNVYSLTHARQLREFVAGKLGNNVTVHTVFESDALAYYLRSRGASDSAREFYNRNINSRQDLETRIVAIDVGRGTTDVSLIRMQPPLPDIGIERHCVLARTGVCSGGQELTYILVKYYNERLLQAFRDAGISNLLDFINYSPLLGTDQEYSVNPPLEALIEVVKASIDERYQLKIANAGETEATETSTKQRQEELIGKVADEIVTRHPNAGSLRDRILELFLLPTDLANPSGVPQSRGFFSRTPPPDPLFAHIHKLKADIEGYVIRNTTELLDRMHSTAQRREAVNLSECTKNLGKVLKSDRTFVLVAGQAAQFRPIKRAIKEWFDRRLPKGHLHFEADAAAKLACCKGAIAYLQSHVDNLNRDEFFGTYGLLRVIPGAQNWVPANTVELLRKRSTTLSGLAKVDYHFVFVARDETTTPPVLGDGYTALIDYVYHNHPLEMKVKYSQEGETIQLNGKDLAAIGPGYAYQDIGPKIWPLVPPPA
jgi:hypothetical protein